MFSQLTHPLILHNSIHVHIIIYISIYTCINQDVVVSFLKISISRLRRDRKSPGCAPDGGSLGARRVLTTPEVPVGVRQHGRWMEATEFCVSRELNLHLFRKKRKEAITLTIVMWCQGKTLEYGTLSEDNVSINMVLNVFFPQNFGIKKTFVRGERWWISSIQRSLHFCWKVKVSGILPKWRRVVKFWFEFGVSRFKLSRYDQSRGWSMFLQKLGSCLCLFVAPDFRTYILILYSPQIVVWAGNPPEKWFIISSGAGFCGKNYQGWCKRFGWCIVELKKTTIGHMLGTSKCLFPEFFFPELNGCKFISEYLVTWKTQTNPVIIK